MRLIDADKLMLSLEEWELNETPISTYPKPKEFTADDMQRMIWRTIRDCESAVEEQPTVDAEPVRHGKFIGTEYDGYADGCPVYYEWKCSQCGCEFEDEKPTYKYCPNCGAKMDEEKENETNRR